MSYKKKFGSEGKVILFEGESRTVFRVKLREPSSVLEYKLIFPNQDRLYLVALVIPGNHISFQLKNVNTDNFIFTCDRPELT